MRKSKTVSWQLKDLEFSGTGLVKLPNTSVNHGDSWRRGRQKGGVGHTHTASYPEVGVRGQRERGGP